VVGRVCFSSIGGARSYPLLARQLKR
jgi:hypothetical protein